MELFQKIPIDRGDETIRAALSATINRARENQLATTGWSLAELALGEGDAEWLRNWARTLDYATARRWLLPEAADGALTPDESKALPARRAAIGVLFLLLTVEQARRKMPRNDDWLIAPVTAFNEPIRNLLFNQDQPTELYINTLMQASERLRLRQNGGWTSPASEHENIALQIALTEADLPERWPQWLRGAAPPKHIAGLLNAETGSYSFQKLWQDCCDFLESSLSETELRAALSASPWVLTQWVNVIITSLEPHRQQIAQVMLMEAEIPLAALPPESVVVIPQPVLSPVEVSPQSQFVHLGIFPISELGDIFDTLTPYGGVKTIIRAARALLARADKLGLRGKAWSLAELRATGCDYLWLRVWVKRLEVLTVWFGTETEHQFNVRCRADEEYVSYRAALGCLLLLWLSETARRNANEDEMWATLNPEDFDQAVAAELFRNNQPSRFLRTALAAAVRELNLRHALDDSARCWMDTVFLQFGFSQPSIKQRLPELIAMQPATQATTRALRELLDEKTGSVSFQSLWRALRGFRQGELAEEALREAIAKSEWVLPEWADGIILAAQQPLEVKQETEAATPEAPTAAIGAMRLIANEWQVMTGDEILTVEDARTSRFRLITPARRDDRGEWIRWAVMEGDVLAQRWEDGNGPLPSLNGLGAPLTVKCGPFDNPTDEFRIAASVIDHGIIEAVVCESLGDGAARVLRLKVANRAEPSDKHFIVWWNENGEVGRLAPDYCDDAEDGWWWVCKVPDAVSRFIAVAIARDGLRIGAWWQDDWVALLSPVMEGEPLMAAALMRWFRLPVLGQAASTIVRRNCRKYAPEFLSAWLKDYGLPEWLRFESSGDRWPVAARALFHQWWPDAEAAGRVLMTLANAVTMDDLNENLLEVSRLLCWLDPLLLAAILRTGKEQVLLGSPSELRMRLAGCQTRPECDARKQALLAECAEELVVDRSAIQAGLLDCAARWLGGYELHPHEECNLALAAQNENARLLVALHLLERI
ncbi:MAG: hypothetical protein M3X11_05435 [Acidobacteriota bacterium]|nr:hypothetical protein [Acidobacteriota bacterium]